MNSGSKELAGKLPHCGKEAIAIGRAIVNPVAQSPTSSMALPNFDFGVRFLDLRKARGRTAPNITTNGMMTLEPTVCFSAVLPALLDFPYSSPLSSVMVIPSLSSLFLIRIILVALAAEIASQMNTLPTISLLTPLIFEVRGANALFKPRAQEIEAARAAR